MNPLWCIVALLATSMAASTTSGNGAGKVKKPPVPDNLDANGFGCENNSTGVGENMELIDRTSGYVYICRNCSVDEYNQNLAKIPPWQKKNGPKTRMADEFTICHSPGFPGFVYAQFYGLNWTYGARIVTPDQDNTQIGDSKYNLNQVWRDTYYTYYAGKKTYQLIDDLGRKYVMQTSTNLTEAGKNLPKKWKFEEVTLKKKLVVHSESNIAMVVTDEYGNAYQRYKW